MSCLLIQPWYLAVSADAGNGVLTPEAAQTADILGIRQEAEQIIFLRKSGASSDSEGRQLNNCRALVLRKIFEAVLQLQTAESQLEFEIDYSYEALAKEQRKENAVNQFFNILNFAQSGVFGLVAPYDDIHKRFIEESIVSLVSGGIGTVLPVVGIFYTKFAKASHLTPPAFMSPYLNGKPVDGSNLPPMVARYLDSPASGESKTRKEVLNSVWRQRYKADMAKKGTLFGIDDGKAKNQFYLDRRQVLLWSLLTCVEGFNYELLSLLNQVRGSSIVEDASSISTSVAGGRADDAARLLHLEPLIAELNSLNVSGRDNERQRQLQLTLLETLLAGDLDMAVASDRCQKELNYQYDVVLAELTARQGNFIQMIFEANFIQGGTLGSIGSYCFLKKYFSAAGEVLLASGGIGLSLTGISFLALQGGWRKNQSGPNSLADFFNLRPDTDKGFSPLVWAYLNSSSPSRTDSKSRRQCLEEFWTKNAGYTIDLKNRRLLEKLGSMPSCKHDTIKLVLNRIALLSSLREQYDEFDGELLDLLRKAWPVSTAASSPELNSGLSPSANAAATLLGVQGLLGTKQSDPNARLLIIRQVLDGFLSMNADANVVGHEIDLEFKVLDRMERQKNRVIQLTNNVNFLQQGVLGLVASSLGLSTGTSYGLYADQLSIISSFTNSGLALGSVLEQHGGWRAGKAEPNVLGAAFGKESKHVNLSPVTIRYLNAVAPDSPPNLTRREVLIKYWKESKVLNVSIKRDSAVQKLSAEGQAQHWWSETINLINIRISMLFDLRAVLQSSSVGFAELLKAVD